MAAPKKSKQAVRPRTRRHSLGRKKANGAGLAQQLEEAHQREAATAEILKVIASSPSDVQPVFDAIVRSAKRLIGGFSGAVTRVVGDKLHLAAFTSTDKSGDEALKSAYPVVIANSAFFAEVVRTGTAQFISDVATDPRAKPAFRDAARKRGYRSVLVVPMLCDGVTIGLIHVSRIELGLFADHQINLLKTFTDQAVIAIENVRLFNETKEALERQTATSEILQVISSSPTNLQPVFDAILEKAMRLCEAHLGFLGLYDGEKYGHVAQLGASPEYATWIARSPFVPDPRMSVGRMLHERKPVHQQDLRESPGYLEKVEAVVKLVELEGARTLLAVPMLKEDRFVGGIVIYRAEVRPFTQKQIDLLSTFASQAVIAIENARLFNETKDALERQTATAEILKVIASSPSDVQPVFDAIAESARQLVGGLYAVVARRIGESLHLAAYTGTTAAGDEALRRLFPTPITGQAAMGQAVMNETPVAVEDVETDPAYSPEFREGARARGMRSMLCVPMRSAEKAIGAIAVTRSEPGPFAAHHVAVLRTFADQAVIAIENVRLFNETKEALERQTATAEILKVIASSPSDVQPVFDAVAERAARLCEATDAVIRRVDGDGLRMVAHFGPVPVTVNVHKITRGSVGGRAVLERRTVHVDDIVSPESQVEYADAPALQHDAGYRTMLAVPLVREGTATGVILIRRLEARPFTDKQIRLLETFADQAVIAIENVRLFNETKEALERQTTTAEILRVIASSPADVQPVLDAIVKSALQLLRGRSAATTRRVGDELHLAAITSTDEEGNKMLWSMPSARMARGIVGKAASTGMPVCVTDVEADDGVSPAIRQMARARGWRSTIVVPMMREGAAIGTISVTREEAGPFSDHHVHLLQTFADQAVIAIENVRLFNETKEALERQTATAEILNVISRSPTDVQPVFDTIVRSALRLTGGKAGALFTSDGRLVQVGAAFGPGGEDTRHVYRADYPAPIDYNVPSARAIKEGRVVNVADLLESEYSEDVKNRARTRDYRSALVVPMMREGSAIGSIVVTRRDPGLFDEHHVSLLKTFADQAVIAIENVRLFKELQARTEALTRSVGQLTALGEVGQAISSTLDLETVLKTIVSRAVQLTGLDAGGIYEYDERTEEFRLRAAENMSDEIVEILRSNPIRKGEGAVGGTAVTREPIQVPETQDESYQSRLRELMIRTGRRALLAVPLLREDHIIGALAVQRNTPGPFAPEIVELLKTFATQSAMAIQNARLFREIAEKGKQLEVASQHKSQFLASMSHELRTPLNAILGFNEMILGDVYGAVPADMQPPLAQMQTSGKHLLGLINNVLDLAKIEAGRMELALSPYSVHDTVESVRSTLRPLAAEKGLELLAGIPNDLPLAYGDGGRIAQCLMNLAGNALKFTKAGKVEISVAEKDGLLTYRVADTGIGIPPDKIASLFTEFKQTDATIASEYGGTGLGLSISKKFIEMHGGRIWVESELGKGSEFIFEIPLQVKTT